MRTEGHVEEFKYRNQTGKGQLAKFESCIPIRFWNVQIEDIKTSKKQFVKYILPYCQNFKTARANGYGLCLISDNGTAKTLALSFILCKALERGYYCYYTTVSQLEYDMQRGFSDNKWMDRLDLMLQRDFLCIDELLKEKYKETDSWMRTQIERILKNRNDNLLPTLLASNKDITDKDYGATLTSLISGCFEKVIMEPGDYRPNLKKQMQKDMGWK